MNRQAIIDAIEHTPGLPVSPLRALRLLNDNKDVDLGVLISEIEHDPSLVADMLRLVNSASFGLNRRIGSIRDAAPLLGIRGITRVLFTSALSPMAGKSVPGYDLPAGALMNHLIAVGLASESVAAQHAHGPSPAVAFTAGILHDIGKIVMGTALGERAQLVVTYALRENIPFDDAERALLSIDHAEVGAMLLQKWGLPEEIVEAAHWHHRPENATAYQALVDIVHIAGTLSIRCGIALGADGLQYRESSEAIARLALSTEQVEKIAANMLSELDRMQGEARPV